MAGIMQPLFDYLDTGDIVFVSSPTLFGRLIRFFTRIRGESRTKVNHVGMIVKFGLGETARPMIVEAQARVRCHDFQRAYFMGKGDRNGLVIYRPCPRLDGHDRAELTLAVMKYVGLPYGPLKLLLHAGDWLLGWIFARDIKLFRRLGITPLPICSRLVEKLMGTVRIKFNGDGMSSPDSMLDWIESPGCESRWVCVYRRPGGAL